MGTVGCRLFKVSSRSLDLNPIENIFTDIRAKISKESHEKISKEQKKHLKNVVIV